MREAAGVHWDPSQVDVSALSRVFGGTWPASPPFAGTVPELVEADLALEGEFPFETGTVAGFLRSGRLAGEIVEQQARSLASAYERVWEDRSRGDVDVLTADYIRTIHGIAADTVALDAGKFRGEGSVVGGGHVSLADGTRIDGIDHGAGGASIRALVEDLLTAVRNEADPVWQALILMCGLVRLQPFFDGNKRTARLIGSSVLIRAGHPWIRTVPERRGEWNDGLGRLFRDDDTTAFMQFMATSAAPLP